MRHAIKNNEWTLDPRMTRIPQFDERSRKFGISSLGTSKKLRSYTWRLQSPALDQKNDGSCVGHGVAHELLSRPAEVNPNLVDHNYATMLYHEAQKIDPWAGGSYQGAYPIYEGTSVLAGVKVAKSLGWFESYYWAFNMFDLKYGVGHHGPAIIGIQFYEDMYAPDANGFIHPTGREVGGHCMLICGINMKKGYFKILNSWGPNWGDEGVCYMRFEDMQTLMDRNGEFVFVKDRHCKI